MTRNSLMLSLALAALTSLPGCSGDTSEAPSEAATTDPLSGLDIQTSKAAEISDAPVGEAPGRIVLPPEARVAVTAPFPGAAVRVFVVEGQAVRRGQALALVRAPETVQIRGELARARSQLGVAQARADRLKQLADEGIIARARSEEAQAELAQARASLAEQQRLASLGGTGPDGTMTLRAPIGGKVAHVGVDAGGPVDGMEAPFVIEGTGSYQVELQLSEALARKVSPGMPIEVEVATREGAEPIMVGGQILTVSPSIDPATRSVLARASIGAAPGIVAGRNVRVTLKGTAGQTGIAIPASAVTRINGSDSVFVKKGDGFELRTVTVATIGGGQVIISEGLKAGEVVATSSVAELKAMTAE